MSNYSTLGARRAQEVVFKQPRQSEPPMMPSQMNKSRESARTGPTVIRDMAKPPMEGYQPAYHRTDSSNGQNPPRYSMVEEPSPPPRDIKEFAGGRHKESSASKMSPQTDAANQINKHAYLNKHQQNVVPGWKQDPGLKRYPSQQASLHSLKRLAEDSIRTNPSPRYSELGFMPTDDQFIFTNDSVRSAREGAQGNRTVINKEGFRRAKQPIGNIIGNHSTLEGHSSINLRKSNFKQSDFIKGKELGKGKFGKVEVVKHKKSRFVCAMKTVPKSVIKSEDIINQFTRQIKIQSCLTHPNIARLYGFFDDSENIYLLMELGTEGQLYSLMRKKKRFNECTTIYIIRQLCEAVKYLHNLHILHRDIKPENIVITYGTMKLCDFGWAVCKGSELRSTFCGTPLYVSPQILKGQQYDQKIDVWAIGILTYELLVGDIPFEIDCEQELVKIIKEDIVFPQDVQLTNEAKDFILKILNKNPVERLRIEKLLEHPFLKRSCEPADMQI